MAKLVGTSIYPSRCYNPLLYNNKIYTWYGPTNFNNLNHTANELYEIDPATGTATKIASHDEGTTDDHYSVRNVFISPDSEDIFYGFKARWETLKLYKANRQDGSVTVIDINTLDSDLNYPKIISRDSKYLYIYARGCDVGGYGKCWRLYRAKIDCIEDPNCYEKITTFVDDSNNSSASNHTYVTCFKFDKLYCGAMNRGATTAILFILDWDGTVRDLKGNIVANPGESVATNDANLAVDVGGTPGAPWFFKVDNYVLAHIGNTGGQGKLVVSDGNNVQVNNSIMYLGEAIIAFDNGKLVVCGCVDSSCTQKCIPITINSDLTVTFDTQNAYQVDNVVGGVDLSDNALVTVDRKFYNSKFTIYTADHGVWIFDLIPSIIKLDAVGGAGKIDFTIDFDKYSDDEVEVCIEGTSNCKQYTNSQAISDSFTGLTAGTYRLRAILRGSPYQLSTLSTSAS